MASTCLIDTVVVRLGISQHWQENYKDQPGTAGPVEHRVAKISWDAVVLCHATGQARSTVGVTLLWFRGLFRAKKHPELQCITFLVYLCLFHIALPPNLMTHLFRVITATRSARITVAKQ